VDQRQPGNGYGDPIPGGIDPNPVINAIIVTEILPIAPTLAIEAINGGSDLRFTWDTEDGKIYDLLSDTGLTEDPGTWAPFVTNLESSPYEMPVPTDPVRFFAMIKKDPPPLLEENFDGINGPGVPDGWTTSGANGTAWEVGDPSGGPDTGPTAASSDPNCAGTNIAGNYTDSADVSLITPVIGVPAGGATLSFQQFIDTDLGGDVGTVRILDADNSDAEIVDGFFP